MKKFLTFFLTALLTFTVGWAANVTDVLNRSLIGVTGTSYTDWSGKTSNSDAVYAGNSAGGSSSIQLRATNPSGIVSTTSGGKVRRVIVEWNNNATAAGRILQIYGKNTPYTSAADLYNSNTRGTLLGTIAFNNGNQFVNISDDYQYIGLRSSNGAMFLTEIQIYWETSSSSIVAPTITPDGGDILASQEISMSAEDGASIYYTINGNNPTTSSTLYTAPFTLNSGATVKAIAVKDGVSSTVTSATFNVVAGVPTIAAALAYGSGQFIFAGEAVVTYQNGRNVWIRDNSGSGLIYRNSGETSAFNNGDILKPGWKASNTTHQQTPEFGSPSGVTYLRNDGTVAPEPLDALTVGDVNKYVSMSNVTVTSVDGDNYYVNNATGYCLRKQFTNVSPTLTVGKTYNVVGVVWNYNGLPELYLISAEEVVNYDPTITLDPTSLTIDDSGTNNSFTVTARNLHENDNGNVSVTHNWVFNTNLTSGTNSIANWNGLQGFNRNYRSVDGTVTVNYEGRALTATDTYTVATEGASQTLTVTYVPSLYIVGNFGNAGWNYSADAATPMTNDGNGIYTATLQDIPANSYILFSRKSGETYNWDTNRYFIGAVMDNGADWVYGVNALPGSLDTNPSNPYKYRPINFPEGGTYTITIDANNYTFNITKEVPLTGDFVLVTDDSQLAEGNEIIIVNSGTAGEAKAMSTTQGNNNRPATNVTVRSILAVTATDETQIITLERAEGDNPGWYFNVGNGYLYAASNSSNQLKTHNTTTDSEVAISIGDDNIASVVFQGDYSHNVMQYNQGSDLFSCYGSASQSPVYIYQRTAQNASLSADKQHITLVTPAGADESEPQTFTVTGSNLTENVTLTVDNPNFVLNPTTIVPENGAVSQVVNVTYVGESTVTENETITITSSGKTVEVYVHGRKEATTLAQIEASTDLLNKKVAVSDELIGAWAYGNKLWAKDQGNASIDKRMAATDQMDYLQQEIWHDQDGNVYHLQTGSWDESNWVVLDFNGLRGETTAAACVGKKLTDVKGTYSDSKNFTITLTDPVTATADADAAALYPGYQQSGATHINPYDLGYNSYIPANFYESNWNGVDAINSNTYVDNQNDDAVISLYFMNPKVQEVARIWGVWNGNGGFAVYNEGYFNRFGIHGAVNVGGWEYNYGGGGVAADLVKDQAYLFHAVVAKPATTGRAAAPAASNDAASSTLVIYPLDLSAQGSMTAVKDIVGDRTVKSVSYYNIMGVESAQPHDGVNIVVTRYTDGSTSTAKVMF